MRILATSALILGSLGMLLLAAAGTPQKHPLTATYLGFDRNDYPGDDALPVLRKTFAFASYWIGPPPGEKSSTWLGKRALLESQGFGFAVLFNGRQSRDLKFAADATEKGIRDAQDAAKAARHEGFPPRTVIFLDIEEGGRLSASYHEYVHAWIDTLAKVHFRAGAYCSAIPVDEGGGVSITTVKDLQDHLGGRKLAFWIFNDACPPSPGCVFPNTPPTLSKGGLAEAAIWQYAQSPRRKDRTARCAATYAADGNCYAPGDKAHKWFLDVNVVSSRNPSAPLE